MARVVLLGDPVAHSLSPAMQNVAFEAAGLPHRYELMRVPAAEVPNAIGSLRGEDFLGANVTIPHKERIAEHLDGVLEAARRIGAVNTIFKRDGRLLGENTDAGGFGDAIAERGVQAEDRRVLLLGSGGAARACFYALHTTGARLGVSGRSPEHVSAMVSAFTDVPALYPWPEGRQALRTIDVLVNATSLGMKGEDPLARVDLPATLTVVDLVATAEETPLVRRAKAAGCVVVDGLLMLLHQGARAFTLWTGREAPIDAMRAALPRRV